MVVSRQGIPDGSEQSGSTRSETVKALGANRAGITPRKGMKAPSPKSMLLSPTMLSAKACPKSMTWLEKGIVPVGADRVAQMRLSLGMRMSPALATRMVPPRNWLGPLPSPVAMRALSGPMNACEEFAPMSPSE